MSKKIPLTSNYIDVLDSKMHVATAGEGDPILFLHGNPSNGFLWRNIAPHCQDLGQVIVPDLIGMGKSDKPDLAYTYEEHYRYLDALITQLGLKNITLVLHDWGSGLGFNYFAQNRSNVKAIAFMEGIIQDVGTFFPEEVQTFFKQLRSEDEGWRMIGEDNVFLNDVFPTWILRNLTDEESEAYMAPFKTVESRKPIHEWVRQVPLHGQPATTAAIVKNYREALQESTIPKLFFYADPGAFMPKPVADWIKEHVKNLESIYLGEGSHFLQEDHPEEITKHIKRWINSIN